MWLAGWAETMRMFYLVVSKKKKCIFPLPIQGSDPRKKKQGSDAISPI
jgi:hypothetical protein